MCRNHSHLVARLMGITDAPGIPMLEFALAASGLTIQAPGSLTPTLLIPRVGWLYVPSYLLAGTSELIGPATEELSTSAFLIPRGAETFMQQGWKNWANSLKILRDAREQDTFQAEIEETVVPF